MALAFVHVIGALVVSFAFWSLITYIGLWEQERIQKRRLQDMSIALGVPVDALDIDESLFPKLIEYAHQRFSGELLRNRLSDLCGTLRTVWGWLSSLLQIGIVIGVGWGIFTDGPKNAAYMWSVLCVSVFFWLAGVAFSFVCLLLTGRYPGEAKIGRRTVAMVLQQHEQVRDHSTT